MSLELSAAEYKVFRQLQQIALERFCQRVLAEIERIASDSGKSAHQRYQAVFELIDAGTASSGRRSTILGDRRPCSNCCASSRKNS